MAWYDSILTYKWWIIGAIAFIIFCIIMIKKIKKLKGHIHQFRDRGFMVVENHPRIVKTCERCGVSIHTPIYTRKKLKEMEDALYDRQFREDEE